jgi:hypothetical protein
MGHAQATRVDVDRASAPAMSRIGAGMDTQNQCSPALAEKSVRKSLTATLRKIEVVIWP